MALDFPTSPTNGQVYGAYVYDSSITAWRSKGVAQAATYVSDTAPSGAVQGDMWYRSTDGTTYVYYKDADTSQWVEIRSEIATSQVGLVPVVPTSVAVGSGSATSNSSGTISFSGATSISLNGCFTGSYLNYRVLVHLSSVSASGQVALWRLRAGGADNANANYSYVASWANNSAGFVGVGSTTQNQFLLCNMTNTQRSTAVLDFINPQANEWTTVTSTVWGHTGSNVQGGAMSAQHNALYQADGFTVYAGAGNMTGTIQVYGYR